MQANTIKALALHALEDLKAKDITVLDVRQRTTMTDWMIIASGTSIRHIQALAENVAWQVKKNGQPAHAVEGIIKQGTNVPQASDWVIVDCGDVVVHVMSSQARDYYTLEQLWAHTTTDKSHQQKAN